jgi:hypothetical protein
MTNTTPAPLTPHVLAKADPFVQRAEDDLDWARSKIIDQANEMRGRLARIVKEMQEPHAGPPATASMLSDAAQFERYLVEFEQKRNLLRTIRALRRAVAVPVEEAAAAE